MGRPEHSTSFGNDGCRVVINYGSIRVDGLFAGSRQNGGGLGLSCLRALRNAETTIENCRSSDGDAVRPVRRPPHTSVFYRAGICNIVNTAFSTRAGIWLTLAVSRAVVDQGIDVV